MFCQTFRVFVWGCFWVRLTIQLVDWIKQIALHNMGGPHTVSRTMDLPAWWPLNQAIGFSWFYSIFWPLDLNWDIGLAGFWTCQPPESHEPIPYNLFAYVNIFLLKVQHSSCKKCICVISCKNGKGNGNPLQDSCLENSVDGGAWWAAVHGVAQSQTRLKQLSSSSSSMYEQKELRYGFSNDDTGLVAPQHVGSSQSRDQIHVPCIGGGFLTTGPPGKPLELVFAQEVTLYFSDIISPTPLPW